MHAIHYQNADVRGQLGAVTGHIRRFLERALS
jgi:hypothetical protein